MSRHFYILSYVTFSLLFGYDFVFLVTGCYADFFPEQSWSLIQVKSIHDMFKNSHFYDARLALLVLDLFWRFSLVTSKIIYIFY